MDELFGGQSSSDEGEWISVSDLMAGLMVIFLFIAVFYIRPLVETKERALHEKKQLEHVQEKIKKIATAWQYSEISIYQALMQEFRSDLKPWNAEIERDTLVFRFKSPEVLFDQGAAILKPRFEAILQDFFPRYIKVLHRYRNVIEEIRIEGHTSSRWNAGTTPDQAYFKNMQLSQQRTRAVLEYSLLLPSVIKWREWARAYATANGLSSSRLIRDADGLENYSASRRVEFRVRTKTQSEILKILEEVR